MDSNQKQRALSLLEQAKDRVNNVYYDFDSDMIPEQHNRRFAKRADTIVVKILNLMDDIRCA